MANDNQNLEKLAVAKAAIKFVKNNDVVGLGTGSTATIAIKELAKLMVNGLKIIGVPSSEATKELAASLGIPLLELGKVNSIDISIDGADEFTENFELIKGGGGALFREKIVASLSKNRIIITDSSKKVNNLGAFKVPIEVLPTAYQYVVDQLEKLEGSVTLRYKDDKIFITDNLNYIVDVDFGLIDYPEKLGVALNQIDGILAHGIFIKLTTTILMAKDGNVITYSKKQIEEN
ncbi:ribose-5-phosphate isomerase RpiA [Pedobacter polaris]|uniref:Ribose-5-phosphate isomerase A n=1 Tax=Pedobacter polaris TaxID=2571273 RepID=A0A4U1CR94_9SPHI|nr:ribose-5-phosphate isomerase RpiA [Pedobacter polaris]TKC08272.1 ribose-5-phosphate isomerase RpiA [Pedobacter polaris]